MITGSGAASGEPRADRKAMSMRLATANRMAGAVGSKAESVVTAITPSEKR
jgi:hypothetical protein